MHETRYLLCTAWLTRWLTGQRQEIWEAREPSTAVKLGFCYDDTRHIGSNKCVEHEPFAEALAPDIPKRHSGVIRLCYDAVASLAHDRITGVDKVRRKHSRAIGQDNDVVMLLQTVSCPQHHKPGVAVLV